MDFSPAIMAIIGTVMGGLILWILLFPVRHFVNQQSEKRREQDRKLRIHFDDLKKEARAIMSEAQISEMYGLIVTYAGGTPQYHPEFVGIELPKLPNSFEAHFSKETEMYRNCISRILRTNEGYKELRQKIKTDFESEGIPVVNINPPPKTPPAIYDTIFWPLFSWWSERSQGKPNPHPNFEQIETIDDFGSNHLVVSGWRSGAIAYAIGMTDQQRCKEVITGIAKNGEYESEAAKTIEMANGRVKEIRILKEQLMATLDDIGKFWPGTKKYKFKKVKNCATCKKIF
ncbi:hypothetical protein ACFLVO_01595 [Chloroflexota bacterium]